jgi:hypothetical protein
MSRSVCVNLQVMKKQQMQVKGDVVCPALTYPLVTEDFLSDFRCLLGEFCSTFVVGQHRTMCFSDERTDCQHSRFHPNWPNRHDAFRVKQPLLEENDHSSVDHIHSSVSIKSRKNERNVNHR